ncbi:Protein of unknown function [Lentibacillus halodurans]|uniref:DUF3231 family protein n=1 Tax=Lentibacillus halodurans TaxID=237679 RepID=A0A1I0YP94_9BACI|nr:DUF3231 family protein [Lentibacillus halodurans]SFB14280.1 Protein of unknown function [Lentibacillus halodurans]
MAAHIKLTSAEMSQVWEAYQNASLAVKVLTYFLEKVEDDAIRSIIQEAFNLSQSHIAQLTVMFEKEDMPVPYGFTDDDLNTDAPRLYSDNYFLQHILQLGALGMHSYSMSISYSTRQDVYAYFSEGFTDFNKLHQHAGAIALSKGIYTKPPYVPAPTERDFVKKQNFLTGWFGKRRPLLTVEIANLFENIQRNALGAATITGFSQVAKSKEVRAYFQRGVEIANKHVEIFSSVLRENDIVSPTGSDTFVTAESTSAPFSDKLMMFHTTGMITLGIGFYGLSMSTTIRRDLASHYMRLAEEIMLYSEDGANIMINNGWLEEPPRMVDRNELAKD